MSKRTLLHAGLLVAVVLGRPLADAQTPVRHPFICCDNGLNKVFVVSAAGEIEWEYPVTNGQDVWRLPNGNYLLSHMRGAIEITPGKEIVWEYRSPEGTEVHTCQPLPDGSVMVAECGTSRIVEADREGTIRKEIKLHTSTTNVHLQFRNARKLQNGHYLVAFVGERKLVELDGEGNLVKEIPTPGDVFVGIRLPNGNTLAGCGDGHKVVEFDPDGKIVWQIEENELPGVPLRFVAGLQRLPNGNTVVCNWGGHGHIGQQPLVFEVTPEKQVVWKVEDHDKFRTISNIQLLDVEGDVTKGEMLR